MPYLSMGTPSPLSITLQEPTLTHCYHPESTLCFRVISVIHAVGLGKCIMTMHLYSIIQISFTALKILCPLPIDLSFSHPNNH